MASKRRPIRPQNVNNTSSSSSSNMNFRAGFTETSRAEAKGTRPTAKPSSIKEVLVMMILHICKKTIFFDTDIKVAIYLGSLFIISLLGDFIPFPKTYFSRSDNLFNVYFVKIGWAWTLFFTVPYLFMTSYTICCGNTQKFLKQHLPRILIATSFWFVWTKFFNIIESTYGRCTARNYDSKPSCLKAGFLWHGFDISGHAFILIYSSLILIEEARPIINWESIKEHIRNELYNRSMQETTSTNPLRNLSNEEMRELKFLYERFTPAIRTLFIGMTCLQLLWDVMLVSTMLYYHNMIEKVLSGIFAILTWFFTYRAWYPSKSFLPDSAGKGNFNYQNVISKQSTSGLSGARRRQSLSPIRRNVGQQTAQNVQIPKFMGMPLYTNTRAAAAAQAGVNSDANNINQQNELT
ncbi:acyl-coenzyme A diphosphatase FITM2 [Condylostylus longicornis]|uniref:acyl-coenzyme A diphosphatase FITM2 n=1 Tax=Condylostylus longicornis TaxID=2530218 RepID=UPI00244DAB4C|nr:acyl-coenzyme A diphosphatase FITM2 [Condylostylus longicornis]